MIRDVFCLGETRSFSFKALQYKNGQTAIVVNDAVDHEPWGQLTSCIDGVELAKDEILVKTWSENEAWVPQVLETMPDVFEDTGRRAWAGWSQASIWRLKNPSDWVVKKPTAA